MGIIVSSHHSLHNTNSSATARPASAAPQPQLSCAVEWCGVSPAQQLQPGAGAIQQQQIFCTNLASSTGVKYTSVLSRVCMCVTVQEGDILLYIKYKFSSVVVTRAATLHAAGVWNSQP